MTKIINDNQALNNLPSAPIKPIDLLGDSRIWLNAYSDDLDYLIKNKVGLADFNSLSSLVNINKNNINDLNSDNDTLHTDISNLDDALGNVKASIKVNSSNIAKLSSGKMPLTFGDLK